MVRMASKLRRLVGMLVGFLLLIPTPALAAGNPNPGIAPPGSNPHGLSYGEWNARWWQWAFSAQVPVNPVLDSTGTHCAEGQTGQVWFLAGTFGGPGTTTRSCTVPLGQALLVPLVNCEASNADTASKAGTFPGNYTIDQLRALCADTVGKGDTLER
jgi:hypothetical protein